ncbi:CheW protein [Ancylobacter aquaticus]|uniref:CheW protein n=1 Tax=Ancylobacter aquaticus TaxID=100 RepID=A0A4R1HCM6_ANCAQ|nr:chemotaxis protein CheW [Ancylobacter aquaticus]TCK19777.1 CheW protein [Ancylobacter aquaticus]
MDNQQPIAVDGTVTHRFLTFRIDADFYALPAEDVSEVLRVPAVARVPQAPKSLLGIGNLRGVALPVASVRSLLGYTEAGERAGARAIVLHGATPVALAVDAVEELVSIAANQLEDADASGLARPGERLKGVFRFHDKRDIAKVLDIQPLLAAAFVARARTARAYSVADGTQKSDAQAAALTTSKLITFDVDGQEYALPIEQVREIVAVPEGVTSVSTGDAVARGVMGYRDRLLPLFSLRALLGLPAAQERQIDEKVVVAMVGTMLVGLLIDRMRAIILADHALIEPIPPALAARIGGESRIKAIYRAEGGHRLVSILDPQALFREEVMKRLDTQRALDSAPSDEKVAAKDDSFLIFRLGDDEYGLPIAVVDEVMQVSAKITRVPKTPKFLEGVINLRGEVLPVIDQRRRFDMPALSDGVRRRIIVVRTARHRAGIIVDGVSEILRSPTDAIEPAPDLTGETTRLVSGIINLEAAGRIILVLDPAELLTRAELGLLDAFAKTGPTTP